MPELVRMYIRNVAIGFAISVVFVALLLWANVANLQHLIFNTSGGYLALFLLVFFNGLVFAGVQFAIAVMGMAEVDDTNTGHRARASLPMRDAFATAPVKIDCPDGRPAAPRR